MRIKRPWQLYNRIVDGRLEMGELGVSRTKFYDDFVYHEGGEENVPGTKVPRLRPMNIGERAVGFPDDEVDAQKEGLRAERDAKFAAARDAVPAAGAKPPIKGSITGEPPACRKRGRPRKEAHSAQAAVR
jgi:predicted DNA-binding transcriptional regulator AlpA